MGSAASREAIRSISHWGMATSHPGSAGARKATDEFGSLTFNDEVQRARLPKDVYRALRRSIAQGEPLDHSVADIVASADVKDQTVVGTCDGGTKKITYQRGGASKSEPAAAPKSK